MLVNNAAVVHRGPMAEIPVELMRQVFKVNVFATFALTQGIVRKMVRRGRGRVSFVSFIARLPAGSYLGAYAASKHAIEGTPAVCHRALRRRHHNSRQRNARDLDGALVRFSAPGWLDGPLSRRPNRCSTVLILLAFLALGALYFQLRTAPTRAISPSGARQPSALIAGPWNGGALGRGIPPAEFGAHA